VFYLTLTVITRNIGGEGRQTMFASIFSARRLLGLVRSGDSRRFGLELEADGEAIIAQIASNAALRLVPLTAFVTAKVKRKECVAYNNYPENIVLRAVANYVARRFRVVAISRDRIVRGVIEAMFDQTPIYVIRRDLSSFYETVPLEPVRDRLLYDTAIPRSVRHYLREFYEQHCGANTVGLPRGVGLTTVLVELAMQPFDDAIRAIPGVYRYFRYSDDMLILTYKNPVEVKDHINVALKKLPGMAFNREKSHEYAFAGDTTNPPNAQLPPSTASFDFLGYQFTAEQRVGRDLQRRLWVSIADKKIRLMKTRVYLSLKTFLKDGDAAMLVDRLRVLTGNYRINRRGINAIRRSRFIYAGIYYNYWRCGEYTNGVHIATAPESLRDIDRFVHGHMKTRGGKFRAALGRLTLSQRRRLDTLSFERGFAGRRIVRVPFQRFSKLKAIWRNA
jgi:hypothetical protein